MQNSNSLIVSKKIPKSDKYITAEFVSRLYDTVDNIRDKFYIMWHIETGVRVSDIVGQKKKENNKRELGQEVHNIDFQNNRIYTYDHKKDKWRYVYFNQKTKSILKMWLKERQNLGIKDRQLFPYSEKTCNRILKDWLTRLGFPYSKEVSSHWCRHTFIRLSRRVGRDIKAVQQNTGDSIKTLLNWYSDLDSQTMAEEMAKDLL